MRRLICLLLMPMSACTSPGGSYPSLQPRPTEAIDPRVPVVKPMNNRPVSPALAARLRGLVEQAQSGSSAFDSAASAAERLAAGAGTQQTEAWIAAQEALSGAVAARKPAVDALADIDEIAALALQNQRGIAPNDIAAIQQAAETVGVIDRRQADRVRAVQRQLGL